MTDYELNKNARLTAKYIVEAMKEDDKLLDLIFPPKYLNIEEAAAMLRVPIGTLYQKVDEIPHTKVGKRLIFSERALVRYVERMGDSRASQETEIVQMRKVM